MRLTHISMFSGIGGLDLAAEMAGFETIAQCEIDETARKVLEKHWPNVKRWSDIRNVNQREIEKIKGCGCDVTVISGGFPCQPHSFSGKRLASNDERDLWGELFRVFCESGAKWLMAENVRGLLSSENGRFFGNVLRDLAEMGCLAWWYCFPAAFTGASFLGERVAIVATTNRFRRLVIDKIKEIKRTNINIKELERWQTRQADLLPLFQWDESQTDGRDIRTDDGFSAGMDRIKQLGNAVVPYQFYPIFEAIKQVETIEIESRVI